MIKFRTAPILAIMAGGMTLALAIGAQSTPAAQPKHSPAKAAPAPGAAAKPVAAKSALAKSTAPAAAAAATTAVATTAPAPAGTPVNWTVFSGYKRYHGNCSVCHGPDGLGGTFAPALATSLKTMDHDTFLDTVVNGKENAQLAMPSFGADPNVMCYIEDIYAYLKARSADQIGRGRPAPQPAKPADVTKSEAECMGA